MCETISVGVVTKEDKEHVKDKEQDFVSDRKIDKARKDFYAALMNKKRGIRRTLLQINAVANEYQLNTLSLRAMMTPDQHHSKNVKDSSVRNHDENPVDVGQRTFHSDPQVTVFTISEKNKNGTMYNAVITNADASHDGWEDVDVDDDIDSEIDKMLAETDP